MGGCWHVHVAAPSFTVHGAQAAGGLSPEIVPRGLQYNELLRNPSWVRKAQGLKVTEGWVTQRAKGKCQGAMGHPRKAGVTCPSPPILSSTPLPVPAGCAALSPTSGEGSPSLSPNSLHACPIDAVPEVHPNNVSTPPLPGNTQPTCRGSGQGEPAGRVPVVWQKPA